MRRAASLLAAMFVALSPVAAPVVQAQEQEDSIVGVRPGNRALEEAIAAAKASLPAFWQVHDSGTAEWTSLMVAFPTDDGGREYMRVDDFVRHGDTVTGTLGHQPVRIAGLNRGARVTVPVSDIADWMYRRNGKIWGAFTIRVLARQFSAEDQAFWRENLSPTPLEDRTV